MLRLLAALFVMLSLTPVEAKHYGYYGRGHRYELHFDHHRHYHHGHSHRTLHMGGNSVPALVTVQTAANIPITVATHLATRFQSLIADLVAAGYHPRSIHCYARGGHVPHSRHYAGAACDFDGSLSRSPFMRSAIANRIIVKNRFRNGCSFYCRGVPDCGHVDDGKTTHHRNRRW